jgi:hypothetical protein
MEEQHNTTEKILAAIETKQVTQRPKWYFILRNFILWIPGLLTTFLGAYTIAGILYGVLHVHLENRLYADYPSQIIFTVAIPMLWVVSFALFSIVTLSLVRKTNTGYRHTATQLLAISVACSIVIGILFYALTSASLAGPGMLYRYPTQHEQQTMWNNPDNGRISGVITAVQATSSTVRDFNGELWSVDTTAVPTDQQKILHIGNAIRIVGTETDEHIFVACRVLPWELLPMQQSGAAVPFALHKTSVSCDTVLSHYNQH